MSGSRSIEYITGIIQELIRLPNEAEWVEFKRNNADSEMIGEYISALSNSAALIGKTTAYMVWGIDDISHEVTGTDFIPGATKIGGEELENWLLRLLSPKISFYFHEVKFDGRAVVLLEISAAFHHPVQFKSQEFIRVGSHKVKLKDYPAKERELWRIFDRIPFEKGTAIEHIETDTVLKLLNYQSYFDLLKLPLPEGATSILQAMSRDGLTQSCEAGGWNISNLGAVLFARRLSDFPQLERKAMRVIRYKGNSRLETQFEQTGEKGYAVGFTGLVDFIMRNIPANEVIARALRRTVPMYPELAVRELVANALIHQDFFITGAGPMVEIFDNRLEITNPGAPLVSIDRLLDSPPKSRNERVASLMRRLNICEERGSGIDKVVAQTELFQLPAPLFEAPDDFTRTVLFAHRSLNDMDKDARIRASYLHACLKYVQRDFLTNTSLRERFGIEEHNRSIASRLIRDAVDAGVIVPHDPTVAPKLMKYVPWWAV